MRSYVKCMALVHVARQIGADAIKFAAFKPEQMTINSSEAPYLIADGPWKGRTLYSLYEQSALPFEWIPDLKRAAEAAGLSFILSIYHPETVRYAVEWGCQTIKIASYELPWIELLETLAHSPVRHVILSTGSATIQEIERAVDVLAGKDITLLHCVCDYPAKADDMNLSTIGDLEERFGYRVGLSDHTDGMAAAVCAIALGAQVIEKHIRLDNDGLDSSYAILPDRFAAMVQVCRQAHSMLGRPTYDKPKTFHRKDIEGRMLRVVWPKEGSA